VTEYVSSGEVARGQLKVRNRKAFDHAMAQFKDGEVTVTIERKRATRSAAFNAYYWGVVIKLISEHTGSTADELHEYYKRRFNAKRVVFVDRNGEVKEEERIGTSTAKLDHQGFKDYIDSIRQHAAEDLTINIPDPNPEYWLERTA
jgi:hypothetical protein